MNEPQRGSLYLLTGVIIGLALGLFYSLKIHPVQLVDAAPEALTQTYKNQYRIMIAKAFLSNGDLVRAKARLDLLGDQDVFQVLSAQAQHTLAQNNQSDEARALGILAIELGKTGDSSETEFFNTILATADNPTATHSPPTPAATEASLSPTSAATPDAAIVLVSPTPISADLFILQDLEKICEPRPAQPKFQIEALDKNNQPLPGTLVIISWEGGEERIYTGMKPDQGLGYAEFIPTSGVLYSLMLEKDGIPVQDLTVAECQNSSGETYPGSWIFHFIKS
jgi:hypothetical protein